MKKLCQICNSRMADNSCLVIFDCRALNSVRTKHLERISRTMPIPMNDCFQTMSKFEKQFFYCLLLIPHILLSGFQYMKQLRCLYLMYIKSELKCMKSFPSKIMYFLKKPDLLMVPNQYRSDVGLMLIRYLLEIGVSLFAIVLF